MTTMIIFISCFSFDDLVLRFECPHSTNRWDSPLFIVRPTEDLPFEAINDALYSRKAPAPNQSTLSVRSNFSLEKKIIYFGLVFQLLPQSTQSTFNHIRQIVILNTSSQYNSSQYNYTL